MTTKRHGNKWTINEILSLQREYELLEWTVFEIAEKHERTVMAIMSKLQKECFIDSWNEARGFNVDEFQTDFNYQMQNDINNLQITTNYANEEVEDEDYYGDHIYYDEEDNGEIENNVNQLTKRVWSLETSVGEISSIVKQIFNIFTAKPNQEVSLEN